MPHNKSMRGDNNKYSDSEGVELVIVGLRPTTFERVNMGLKNIFRKLACRPPKEEQDEENQLENDLLEKKRTRENSTKSKRTSNKSSTKSTKNKKRSNKSKQGADDSRYYQELKQQELFTIREVTGKYIDVQASFTPKPKWWITVLKFVIFAWIAFIAIDDFLRMKPKSFYLATFDHWATVVTIFYLFSSFLANALRPPSNTLDFATERNLPGLWHKMIWALFSIAAPSQILSSLAFWIFDYSGEDLEGNLVVHGSVVILLLVEGLCLNRIPLRINHQWFFFAFVYAFLLWTLIHSYLNIGNPVKDRGEHALYPFLVWNDAPFITTIYVLFILLLVVPLIYWVVWMMSLFSFPWKFQGKNRRYLSQEESKTMESYVEMDSDQD